MTSELDADRLTVLVHEVRSPVAALAAIAETLMDAPVDHEARGTLVRLVVGACAGIERLVADVAVASIRLDQIDPVLLVGDVVAAARVRGAAVDLSAPAEVPPVRGDPSRLRQALDNLLSNAFVHGSPDKAVSVTVSADTMVRIAVADAGAGIAPDDLERIFERRVRLEPASPGAGLGLALARAIAEGHGGSLTVASSVGSGTTFTLSLPLQSPSRRRVS
jgi:two-component system sensor histidine kinase BaeS